MDGPFNINLKITLTGITDGTSNTLLVGESLGGKFPGYPRDTSHSWLGSGVWPALYGMPESDTSDTAYLAWSSNHTGVVNFALVDGSVRSLRKGKSDTNGLGTSNYRFRQLAGYRDGRIDDTSSVMP